MGIRRMKEILANEYGCDPAILRDIGMEAKGLEFSGYVSKESLAQQGGYGLANKGPQHDEAWLIFMDLVNGQLSTYEDMAEALHYFPMFRTWFSLVVNVQTGLTVPAHEMKASDLFQEVSDAPIHCIGFRDYAIRRDCGRRAREKGSPPRHYYELRRHGALRRDFTGF
jgi:hypothetical protein